MPKFRLMVGLLPTSLGRIGRMLALVALAVMSQRATAIPLDRSIHELQHTAWTSRDGAPTEISALAQTADGFLWIGSQEGLVRFDGLNFLRSDPVSGLPYSRPSVDHMYAPPSGGLWVGYQIGGAALIKDGKTTSFGPEDGLPRGTLNAFAEDHSGTLWVSGAGLCRFRNGRFEPFTVNTGPFNRINQLFVDRSGVLWAGADNKLLSLRPGASTFVVAGTFANGIYAITQMPDDSLWIADATEAITVVSPDPDGVTVRGHVHIKSAGMAYDPGGSLWITTLGKGLRRLRNPADIHDPPVEDSDSRIESFTRADGLSGDYTWPTLIDREGNLWVGTSRGLDRFHDGPLVPAAFPDGAHDFALAAGDNGSIWAGTTNLPLMRLQGSSLTTYPQIGSEITSARRAGDGSVWFGTSTGIYRAQGEKLALVAPLPETGRMQIRSARPEANGDVWAATSLVPGSFRWSGGQWTTIGSPEGVDAKRGPIDEIVDASGRIWRSYTSGQISITEGSSTRVYSANEGFDARYVLTMLQSATAPGVWVGTENGLFYFDGNTFRKMATPGPANQLLGVSGVVETAAHGMWLRVNGGILNVPAEEVRRFLADSAHPVSGRLFDFLDGLPGSSAHMIPLPTMVQGTDGRIWQATSAGVVWIDPARIPDNTVAPIVIIDAVRVAGRSYRPVDAIQLPAHSSRLQIDYTASALSIPERTRFRYKLEGVDRDWQEAGGRRQAFYSNLAPGRYVFHLMAANDSGVWSTQGAAISFSIAPGFFQTSVFFGLCFAVVLLMLWLIHQVRLTQVLRRMSSLFQERLVERERIARELHDTLLQGVQGLIFEFRGAVNSLDQAQPGREQMSEALVRANQMLAEGRDQVQGLRTGAATGGDLGETIASLVRGLQLNHPCEIRIAAEGAPRAMHPEVQDQVHRIVGEALTNTFNHAAATEVVLDIVFARNQLRLHLRDNGVGIPEDIMKAGSKPGHWGLPGMRERAAAMRGRLSIQSQPGHGTGIDLVIPASIAFRDGARLSPWLRWWSRLDFRRRKRGR